MYDPTYIITNKILTTIAKIEASEEVIRNAPILPLWEKQFKDDAVMRTVYHGTHIEGNLLEKDEAQNILLGKDVQGRSRDIQEVINYRKALQVIDDEIARNVERITEPLIKKLHRTITDKILDSEQLGEYRKKQVVLRNSQTGEISFRPPPAIHVPFLMREFLFWVNKHTNDTIHPIIKAGLVHHEMVRIHPFLDGNGRVARLFATLVLMLGGYDIRHFFSLEEYYDRDAAAYYENLQKASAGDLTTWLEYFCYGAAYEFEKVKERVLKVSQDAKLKERFGGRQIFLTERQMKIMHHIQEVGFIQNKSFSGVFPSVSEDTILRDIQTLIREGLIKKVGSTKAARYVVR